jgi:hypothetical protein
VDCVDSHHRRSDDARACLARSRTRAFPRRSSTRSAAFDLRDKGLQTDRQAAVVVADGYASDAVPGTRAEILYEGRTVAGHVTTVSPEVRDGLVKGTVVFEEPPPGLEQGQREAPR